MSEADLKTILKRLAELEERVAELERDKDYRDTMTMEQSERGE